MARRSSISLFHQPVPRGPVLGRVSGKRDGHGSSWQLACSPTSGQPVAPGDGRRVLRSRLAYHGPDERTGATMDRDGLTALLGFARPGDRINLLTLDRLGRNMRETLNLVHDLTQRGIFLRTLGDKLAVDTSDPGPGTDMAIALLAMFAQMERIYMLERAAGARAAKQARGLPTGRPAKLNATTRAGAAQRIGDGAIPEQVAADLGVSRSTLYRELRKHREGAVAERVVREG